jgi:hypothetical protein
MKLTLSLIMAVLIGLCLTPAWAQNEANFASAGTVPQVKWIGGLEFDSAWNYAWIRVFENRELYNQGGDLIDNPDLSAAFHLPSGARLIRAKLYAYDSYSSEDVNVKCEIVAENWPSKASNSLVTIETDTDDNGPGYTTEDRLVGHNIKNKDNWYHARVTLDNADRGIGLRLWGVRLYYKLRVSEGPAVPTFNDVSQSNQFYDAIEAMYASGITQGCPYPNFCPKDYVTREQMAAFFARALGLYWAADDGF